MEISRYISELLYEHDCVIVPGLGGFVANLSPASVNPAQHVFSPPSKEIVFNKNLKRNDGLLAHHIAVSENKTYSDACSIIHTWAEEINEKLKQGERVAVDKVGVLYFDIEQNIQFEPDRTVNYLIDSFGLTPLHSLPVKRGNYQDRLEKHFIDRKPAPQERKNINVKRIAAVSSTLALLFIAVWIPLNTELLKKINYSSLNPFAHETSDIPVLATKPAAVTKSPADHTYEQGKDAPADTTRVEPSPVTVRMMEDEKEKKYHIIGGCFTVPENAGRLVSKLRKEGYKASILDQDKQFYRVEYNSYASRTDALLALANIRSVNPQAWLLVK